MRHFWISGWAFTVTSSFLLRMELSTSVEWKSLIRRFICKVTHFRYKKECGKWSNFNGELISSKGGGKWFIDRSRQVSELPDIQRLDEVSSAIQKRVGEQPIRSVGRVKRIPEEVKGAVRTGLHCWKAGDRSVVRAESTTAFVHLRKPCQRHTRTQINWRLYRKMAQLKRRILNVDRKYRHLVIIECERW